ncbi:MAG: hypothetical protein IJF33_01790 [Clostridia bacterium]|nr:hypothetical protein [Clostridia bacterium]
MGTPMGYFSEDRERDFPDLNKCPDCETFFESLNCPICGKPCPEEMRAGNRKPVKVKKQRYSRGGSGRVEFVPWYLSTWFIILMLFVQPIIGLILMWVGYWNKTAKVILTVLLVLSFFGSFLFGGIYEVIENVFFPEQIPVDTELSREEYVESCEELSAETVYREANARVGEFVALTVTVKGVWDDGYAYNTNYPTYLECVVEEDGRVWSFLIRDYRKDGVNLTAGDVITVYGQIGGNVSIYAGDREKSGPSINMLYFVFED